MAKTASNQLGICLRIMHVRRIPKVSIFIALTTRIVTEKAEKWPKMAKNGKILAKMALKWQGHGTGGIFLSMSMGN